ncbi:MAG: TPM domain-containing protein [Flavobacteriales bacterium]
MSKSLATLLLVLVSAFAWAKEIPERPNRLVNDYANALTSSEADKLEQKLVAYDKETSTQIAVVILKSLEGDDVFDFSQRLAEEWGLGGKENDNGVLLLVSMEDREIRIHTGYGTEGAIPDAIAKRIIETDIKPEFKSGNYYSGINKACDSMIAALKGEYNAPPKKDKFPIGIIPFLIIFILIAIFGRRRRYTTYGRSGRHYHGGPWIGGFGGGSSGGFGGGGGGFGGFGGGGFGGGGASGSW